MECNLLFDMQACERKSTTLVYLYNAQCFVEQLSPVIECRIKISNWSKSTRVITAGPEVNDTNPVRCTSNLNCTPNLFLRPHPTQVCCTIIACNALFWKRRESYRETGWGGRMPRSSFLWLIWKHVLCFRLCFYPLSFPSSSFNRLRPHATQLSIFCSRPVSHSSRKLLPQTDFPSWKILPIQKM